MKRSCIRLLSVLVLSVVLISGCSSDKQAGQTPAGGSAQAPAKQVPKVKIVTSPPGQTWNTLAAALAEYMKGTLTISVEPGSPYGNVIAVNSGGAQFAITVNTVLANGYDGDRYFKAQNLGPMSHVRIVASLYKHHLRPVTVRKDIKSLADLKGGKISAGPSGSESIDYAKQLLSYYGLTESDYTIKNLSFAEAAEAMKNGQLDAIVACFPSPFATIEDLGKSTGARFISIGEENAKRLATDWKGFSYEAYEWTSTGVEYEKPYYAPYQVATIIAGDGVPNEIVYQLTKYVYENFDKLSGTVVNLKQIKRENLVDNKTKVPFHEGALQFYREKGLVK